MKDDLGQELLRKTMCHTKDWEEDFPVVFANQIYNDIKNNKDLENLRIKAKNGNRISSDKLVINIVDIEMIKHLKEKYPNAIVCPIVSQEELGNNRLPYSYAAIFEILGFSIETNVVQISKVYHTGAKDIRRFINRARFTGQVQKDREYILIDDHIDSGSTLRDFKDYIETNGAKVVAFSTLTAPEKNFKVALEKENLERLNQYGEKLDELLREFSITDNKKGLTNQEAKILLGILSSHSRDRRIENSSQEEFRRKCEILSTTYREKIKRQQRTFPVVNRLLKLTSLLSKEDQSKYSEDILKIKTAIENDNKKVLAHINLFNKPEYSNDIVNITLHILFTKFSLLIAPLNHNIVFF